VYRQADFFELLGEVRIREFISAPVQSDAPAPTSAALIEAGTVPNVACLRVFTHARVSAAVHGIFA